MLKVFFILLLSINMVYGQSKPAPQWVDQKYSMFIHWGLYSELGGVWDGKPVTSGYSEQIQSHGGIFSDWYADVARRFDPEEWNADSIVTLAKAAGMKSVVFTSKHHDGFCMYHSGYTDYNIVDATPFKRDVMKELAEACGRQNMHFGVYFSLIDWHFPQAYPISSHNADPLTPEHYAYNLKQVEEIMTRYGEISEIWFDMGSLTPEQSQGLYDLVNRLQPSCMISGRLGNDCSDFSVMADNEYPDYKIGVPWQTAASFFDETWGYRSWQERGNVEDKANEKIRSLIKVVSRGGNYLLNIGPDGRGNVIPFEKEALLKIGSWLDKYGESIYGTKANPFTHSFGWGDVTMKGNSLYLFVDNKVEGALCLPGLKGQIINACYVGGGDVAVEWEKECWNIYGVTPEYQKDSPVTVIRLDMADGYRIEPSDIVKGKLLTPWNSVPVYAYSSMDYYTGFQSTIAYTWGFEFSGKQLEPVIWYTQNEQGKDILIGFDGEDKKITLKDGLVQRLNNKGVTWGKVYSKPSGSIFGRKPVSEGWIDVENAGQGWQEWQQFRYGEKMELDVPERRSVLLLQNIMSDHEQDVLVEIGSGNGVQVFLNGHDITQHIATRGSVYNKEQVLLPLKKGQNQLVVKFYNRFEKPLCLSLQPVSDAVVYKLKLEPFVLFGDRKHTCSMRLAAPVKKNSAMRLSNVKISL